MGAAGLLFSTAPSPAQVTPGFFYHAAAGGTIRIFNSSKVITVTGQQTNTTAVSSGVKSFSHNTSMAGSALEQRFGGAGYYPFSMQVASAAGGHAGYGHLHFHGNASVSTQGHHFTNASATHPQTAYGTEEAEASAGLTLAYNDVLHVESAMLPTGTPVVVRASLDAYISPVEKTVTSPVLVNYPPSGPGFPATSAYVLETTAISDKGFLEGEVRLTSRRPGVTFPSVDDKFLWPLAQNPSQVDVDAVVGGQITISHSSEFSVGAMTASGNYAATSRASSSYNLTCQIMTGGATLRSESGHNYSPATGVSALLQVYNSPDALVLTAPAGAIFQKLVTTPAGIDWLDLPQTRMLVVPFDGATGFFRVRQP